MPIQNTDLMVVQQGNTPYKVSAQTLRTYFQTGVTIKPASPAVLGAIKVGTNLSITADGTMSANISGALTYKGVKDFTAAPGITTPSVGDLYVNNKSGPINAGWTGLGGDTGTVGGMVIWDGVKWALIGAAASTAVSTVTADSPITVTATNPTKPHISIATAQPSTAGAGGAPGVMTAVMAEKLDGIASGAKPGTVTNVTGTAPVQVANGDTTPVISIDVASTTA